MKALDEAIAHARQRQQSLTAQLKREWDDFAAGRCALPWRGNTMKRWHEANARLIRLTAPAPARRVNPPFSKNKPLKRLL